jgi:predicted hotdog family 3-hydroxylacyl-ACP dehydratase
MNTLSFPIAADIVAQMLPQKEPFVLVSEILNLNETSCTTSFSIPENHVLVFDGKLSAAGLIENIAQSCAAMMGAAGQAKGESPKVGFIGDIRNFNCEELPPANNTIQTSITIENQIFDVTMISGNVFLRGKKIASCQMKIFVKEKVS